MKKKAVLSIVTIFAIALMLTFVQANIKTNKDNYNTGDSIYAISTVGGSDYLCRSQEPAETVKLYVVNYKDQWFDGDLFEEVRDDTTEVPNSRFSNTKIWEDAPVGTYNIIIDCNDNQQYDELSELLFNTGFTVSSRKGSGTISIGKQNPTESTWQYDPEEPELFSEILQLELLAKDENIKLENLSFEIDSPFDQTEFNIEFYLDKNSNGKLDPVDTSIAILESSTNKETINLDHTINKDVSENILVVFNLDENVAKGDYNIEITSLEGIGTSSNKIIKLKGIPITSNTLKILDIKTCLGNIKLTLTPNPAISNTKTIANVNGISNCKEKRVSLRASECYRPSNEVGSCILSEDKCEIEISVIAGNYFICIDKNEDGDQTDIGESASQELKIIAKENEEEETENTEEEEETPTTGGTTGQVIGTKNTIAPNNQIFVLLEITLLLILFILVLILFNLRRGTVENLLEPQEEEDTSDLFSDFSDNQEDKLKEDKKDPQEEIEKTEDSERKEDPDENQDFN